MELLEQVEVFRDTVEKEKVTIPRRSPKLFTISALYEANEELLGKKIPEQGSAAYREMLKRSVEYWTEISKTIGDWQKVKNGELSASELRQEKINTHAVVLRALGGVGRTLLEKYPHDWQRKVKPSKESTGENLSGTVQILCGIPYVSQRARWFPTDRHAQQLWLSC